MMKELISKHYAAVKNEMTLAIESVVNKCDYDNPERVLAFEAELAKKIDIKNVVTCHSAAAAAQMLLMAYGIGRGDAVFMSDLGSLAVAEAIRIVGATPVFVDVETTTGCFDIHHLEVQIQKVMTDTKLTPKAVVATDCFGRPEDYLAVNEIIRTYGLILIEDAITSLGGSYKGLKCGCFGHAALVSFDFGSPLFGIGNGAAVLTDFNDVAGLISAARRHGLIDGNVQILGMESRLDVMQAEVLRVQLRHFEQELLNSAKAATIYDEALREQVTFLQAAEGSVPSNNEYVFLATTKEKAAEIRENLAAKGWRARSLPLILLHKVEAFADTKYVHQQDEFSGSADLSARAVCLPISPYLDVVEQDEIIDIVLGCLQ